MLPDAQQAIARRSIFLAGLLPLVQRSLAENYFWVICTAYRLWQTALRDVICFPEELEGIESLLPIPISVIFPFTEHAG